MALCTECRGPDDGPQLVGTTVFHGDFDRPECDGCGREMNTSGEPVESVDPLVGAASSLRVALVQVFR